MAKAKKNTDETIKSKLKTEKYDNYISLGYFFEVAEDLEKLSKGEWIDVCNY